MKLLLTLVSAIPFSLALSNAPVLDKKNALQSRSNTTCASLHIIVARASLEPQGEGIIGAVASQIEAQIPGSDSVAVVYPATIDNYLTSEAAGVAGMMSLISSYEAQCPNGKIALLGYSQGAQVIGDVLCGTSEAFFNTTAPEKASMVKNIVASIQMGDPSFALHQPQDVGNATKGGIFHRNDTAACPSSIMQSYCDYNDYFCDVGTSLEVHLSYVQVYGAAAVKFVVGKYEASINNGTGSASPTASGGSSSSNGTGSASPTASGGSSSPTTSSSSSSSGSPSSSPISTSDGGRLGGSSYLEVGIGMMMISMAYAWL